MTPEEKHALDPGYTGDGGTVTPNDDSPIEAFGAKTINYPLIESDVPRAEKMLREGKVPKLRFREDGKSEIIDEGER